MPGEIRDLKKGDILFKEGDPSDALFVIKKGRIAVTKTKGSGEIELAELGPGEMIGEMAFFDGKPRSAGGRAKVESQVIVLPFQSLYAQFKSFPEWLKAMVKTINAKLRDANAKIKNLESLNAQETVMFSPHQITRYCALISLIGYKSGKKENDSLVIPYSTLRNYCIQIFQQPTGKLDKMMDALQGLGLMQVEDLGEGRKKVSILKHNLLSQFVDWYNDYIFKSEDKRVTLEERELPVLKALAFYGKKAEIKADGSVTINLIEMQNNSMRDLNYLVNATDADSLAEKKIVQDKQSGENNTLTLTFNLQEIETLIPYWEIVFTLTKIPAD
jgi:CRP-like cAMP-binding protein